MAETDAVESLNPDLDAVAEFLAQLGEDDAVKLYNLVEIKSQHEDEDEYNFT